MSKYQYRIELLRPIGGNVVREFESDFEVSECWGYNRFHKISFLERDGFLPNDTLTFRFYVRAPTYSQDSRDKDFYISRLER